MHNDLPRVEHLDFPLVWSSSCRATWFPFGFLSWWG